MMIFGASVDASPTQDSKVQNDGNLQHQGTPLGFQSNALNFGSAGSYRDKPTPLTAIAAHRSQSALAKSNVFVFRRAPEHNCLPSIFQRFSCDSSVRRQHFLGPVRHLEDRSAVGEANRIDLGLWVDHPPNGTDDIFPIARQVNALVVINVPPLKDERRKWRLAVSQNSAIVKIEDHSRLALPLPSANKQSLLRS